ncbi:MAG: hypothetical protein RTV31_09210 [Candidatus Thorarchaeota archaeon]
MPNAEVLIQIDYLGQSIFDIDFVGEYTIQANKTQDCTLAYAYPNSWTEGLVYDDGDLFNITFDDTPISCWPIEFENSSWIRPWDYNKLYHISCDPQYIAFNVSFQADVNHTLNVNTEFRKTAVEHGYLDISYVCGTAVSFEGCTRETITIEANAIVPLSSIRFAPLTNCTITNTTNGRVAVWELVYPADYWPVYDPVDAVYTSLIPFENETLPSTPEETTYTTTEGTNESATPNILGPIAISGSIGLVFGVSTIVLWKSKKM